MILIKRSCDITIRLNFLEKNSQIAIKLNMMT